MTIRTLTDLYIDQLQDIYSANKQSLAVTKELREAATSSDLTTALDPTQMRMAVKGLMQSDPHDARILKAFALGLAVATRGMDHQRA